MRTVLILLLLHLMQLLAAQSKNTKTLSFKCEANLELYNGQNGIKSEIRGAVTVANKNDTDGDGTVDNDDFTVVGTTSLGRDEVDLMKLVIKKNTNVDPTSLLIKKTGGNFRLWRKSNKSDSFTLNSLGEAYLIDLPFNGGTEAVLYVEAPEASATKDDIKIQLLRNTPSGTVVCDDERATAIWYVDKIVQLESSETPIPKVMGELEDLDNDDLKDNINDLYRSVNGTRWGFGYFNKGAIVGDNSNTDKRLGGRIVMQFTLFPNDLDDSKPLVKMDITRQKMVRTHSFAYDATSVIDRQNDPNVDTDNENTINYPEVDNLDNEKANDDASAIDEDNGLTNKHIYSIDVPSILKKPWITSQGFSTLPFFGRRMNFREFVRVVPYGPAPAPYGNDTKGSRASDQILWTCSVYGKLDANDRYVLDNTNVANSAPVHWLGNSNSDGNGSVVVNLGATVPDNSFRVWVTGTSGNSRVFHVRDALSGVPTTTNFNNGTASLTVGGLTVTITDGSIPFNANNLWKFNTFTTTQSEKSNVLSAGQTNVTITP